jgi:hypothetical protein
MPKETHTRAAEHHENAAKAHRTAAEHHGKGDYGKGHEESTKAHEHSAQAHRHSTEAHGKVGKPGRKNNLNFTEAVTPRSFTSDRASQELIVIGSGPKACQPAEAISLILAGGKQSPPREAARV